MQQYATKLTKLIENETDVTVELNLGEEVLRLYQ